MVVDALLNQETSFFRDAAVLDMVAEAAREMHADEPYRRLPIGSEGCSTGQEPMSLAILFSEAEVSNPSLPFPEIVATDVSPSALTRARSGRFSQFEIQRGLSVRRMMTWFDGRDGDWAAQSKRCRT